MVGSSGGIDISAIWTAAGIVVGFSVGAFGFRLRREIEIRDAKDGRPYWLPRADFVLLASLVVVLLGVFVLPVLGAGTSFARYALGWAFLLLAGYPFALAGHYDLLLGRVPKPRDVGKNRGADAQVGDHPHPGEPRNPRDRQDDGERRGWSRLLRGLQSDDGYRTVQETVVLLFLAVATLAYWLVVILTS